MVRKTHRGIVGKGTVTMHNRPYRGPGISLKELESATGPEIKRMARKKDWQSN